MTKVTNVDRPEIVVSICFPVGALVSDKPQTQQKASHLLTNHGVVSLFS